MHSMWIINGRAQDDTLTQGDADMDQAARQAQMVGAMDFIQKVLTEIEAIQTVLAVKKATMEYTVAIASTLNE